MTETHPDGGKVEFLPGDVGAVRTGAGLADQLRRLRRRHARRRGDSPLTYRELAARTGWAHGVIGDYFTGKTLPPTDRFDILVALLGASKAEIFALATARDRVEEGRRRPTTASEPMPGDADDVGCRNAELAELDVLLGGRTSVVVLTGPAGVGKTSLAIRWAQRHVFADGVRSVDLGGSDPGGRLDPARAAEVLLGGATSDPIARYRDLVHRRRVLVLLDNAHKADQVRPLLPDSGTGKVVVTTRDPMAALASRNGVHRIALTPLAPHESIVLLRSMLGRRLDESPAAVAALVGHCAGLPLALRMAAEYVLGHPELPLPVLVRDWTTVTGRARRQRV